MSPKGMNPHGGRVHVDADYVIWIDPAQVRRDERTEVSALSAVALVPETAH
jgi:hypothetical protein